MKEIRTIVDAYFQLKKSAIRAALAAVVRTEGSSYRRIGARMLVQEDGACLGGISGGCLEGDALRRAQKAIALNRPSVVTYDTTQDDAHQIGAGLGCSGIIDVLFTPLDYTDEHNAAELLSGLVNTRVPRILLTVIRSSEDPALLGRSWLEQDTVSMPTPLLSGGQAAKIEELIADCLARQESRIFRLDAAGREVTLLAEWIRPALHLVLYGSNYDLYPMARLGRELGFDISVVTHVQKAGRSLYESASRVMDRLGPDRPVLDAFTAVMLMTHDFKTDCSLLPGLLDSPAPYVGVLGPRKRMDKIWNALADAGWTGNSEPRSRVHAPAGLDIGANTPEEIALSVLAEIISVFSGRTGAPLRHRTVPIHENLPPTPDHADR
ncbi:MAG TPA: XdhC family protein [Chitinophagaceae bacterium]|nr:XdhC family protein [Chitinophagaceae bacterium]